MKKTTLFLCLCTLVLFLMASLNTQSQNLWKRYIVLFKTFYTGGGVPNYLNQIDRTKSLGVYGLFDSAYIYSTVTGEIIQRTPHLFNTLEYTGTTWQSAGDAVFYVSDRSSVFFHNKIAGQDHIMCTGEEPYFRKRNSATNVYEATGNLKFNMYGGIVFYEWGSKLLLLGYYSLTNNISNLCLWDMQKDTYGKLGGGTLGYDFVSPKESEISSIDSTLVFLCYKTADAANGLRVVLYKDSTWANDSYPTLPNNAMHITIADKNRMWVSTQSPDAANRVSEVYELDKANKKWNKIVTLKKSNPFATASVSSLAYGNGQVYVAGDFDSANSKAHRYVIAYNTADKSVADPATNNGLLMDNGGCSGGIYLYFENNNLYAFSNGCSIFGSSSVYALTNNGVLPITLQSFTGKGTPRGNELQWAVAPASKVASFSVERSADGVRFSTLELVIAKKATISTLYTYLDADTKTPTTYYRLKLIDERGNVSYSKIIVINRSIESDIAVFPVPAHDYFKLKDIEGVQSVQIVNELGQVVKYFGTIHSNQFAINDITPGYYSIRIIREDKSTLLKLIKQ